jgi:5-methyltetrahydrofolate--homocysteine methyltransferase
LHTALKIAPVYPGPVVHMKDASQNVLVAARLMNPVQKENYIQELNNEYALLRQKNEEKQVKMVSLEEAQQNKLKLFD